MTNEQRTLEMLKRCRDRGANTEEVSEFLGVSYNTTNRILRRLCDKGLVVLAGSGKTKAGNEAINYRVVK